MPIIHATLGVAQITNDPSAASTCVIDLPLLLSQKYGRMVRQGHSVQVTGIQARLRPMDSGYDVGLAISGSMGFVPTTKHSRRAWNEAYRMWRKQKALGARVGSTVNSDDLEFCWSDSDATNRTSHIFATGMGDTIGADMGLTGASNESGLTQYFGLGDFYDSSHPIAPPSTQHWDSAVFKAKKYSDLFPQTEYCYFSSEFSTVHSDNPTATSLYDDALSGASAHTDIMEFPEPVNALCGLLKFTWYTIPDDTGTQNQGDDVAEVDIVIFIKSWKALPYSTRRKSKRYTRRSRGKRNYRSRKTYARRKWSR